MKNTIIPILYASVSALLMPSLVAETVTFSSTSATVLNNNSVWTRSGGGTGIPVSGDDVYFNNDYDDNISQALRWDSNFTFNSLNFDFASTQGTLNLRSSNSGVVNYTLTIQSGQITRTGAGTGLIDIGDNSSGSGVLQLATTSSGYTINMGTNNANTYIEAAITGAGKTLNKFGNGSIRFTGSANNTYTGLTTVNQGSFLLFKDAGVTSIAGDILMYSNLQLRTDEQIADTSNLELSGGRLDLYSQETLGMLTLSADTVMKYNAADSVLMFADSSGETWDESSTLSIYNWIEGTSGLYFGSDISGLTATQLEQIQIYSDGGTTLLGSAHILSNGQITAVPESSSFAWMMGLAMLALLSGRMYINRSRN